jgi:hypothetical protein
MYAFPRKNSRSFDRVVQSSGKSLSEVRRLLNRFQAGEMCSFAYHLPWMTALSVARAAVYHGAEFLGIRAYHDATPS